MRGINMNTRCTLTQDSGIYCIEQLETGKRYIGSTNNIQRRSMGESWKNRVWDEQAHRDASESSRRGWETRRENKLQKEVS